MKIGFFPGSFSIWHEGHQDILDKAQKLFDKIIILQLTNPDKPKNVKGNILRLDGMYEDRVQVMRRSNTFLTNIVGTYILGHTHEKNEYAIIRGLRNAQDLEYEKGQQYWNEDLGMKIPTVYFISDRRFTHISSSAIRMVNKLLESQNATTDSNS